MYIGKLFRAYQFCMAVSKSDNFTDSMDWLECFIATVEVM